MNRDPSRRLASPIVTRHEPPPLASGVPPGLKSRRGWRRRRRRSSSRGGFLNFGSFWRRTPEDRSPEVTKKPSRTLTSAEKARLFSRLHADPSKAVADPDPEETFRPKISGKSRRIGARVHARENRGMRRVDFLLHKGTEDIRDKNERWRAYDDAPPDPPRRGPSTPKNISSTRGRGGWDVPGIRWRARSAPRATRPRRRRTRSSRDSTPRRARSHLRAMGPGPDPPRAKILRARFGMDRTP